MNYNSMYIIVFLEKKKSKSNRVLENVHGTIIFLFKVYDKPYRFWFKANDEESGEIWKNLKES